VKIAVLGTGMVGQAHAGKLAELGQQVYMGTKDVAKTKARTKLEQMQRPGVGLWLNANPKVRLATFANAARQGEVVINALSGQAAVEVLTSIKTEIGSKIVIDITNPLDFSSGELRLSVCNDNSLAEQIQSAIPKAKIVKAFNTMNASVQINPKSVAKGGHHLFMAGNSQESKNKVTKYAKDWYGWQNILDLGDIKSARGLEMILPIWLSIMNAKGTAQFNFNIAQ